MSINKVTLLGNVCQDPKINTFDNGGKVAQFSLATNKRAFKTKEGKEIPERVEYHNIVINVTGLADVAEKYIKKGDKLYLEGELRTRSYDDSNGVKRYVTEIYVSVMEMLTPKKDGNNGSQQQPIAPPPQNNDDCPF